MTTVRQETQLDGIPTTDKRGILDEATRCEATVKCSCLQTSKGRNLVICVDGTANQLSVKVGICFYDFYSVLPFSYLCFLLTEHQRRRAV